MDRAKLRHYLVGEFSWKRVIRSLLLIYGCLLVFAWAWSDRMLFPEKQASYSDGPDFFKLATEDGKVTARFLESSNSYRTVLYSHGNAEDLGDLREYLEEYASNGYSVLSYDFPGRGTSDGRPTEESTCRAIEAAWRFLVETRHVPPARIVIHGRSVGGGPSAWLASREKPAGLILESTFVTAFRALTHVPLAPFDKFRNNRRIRQVECPVLVIHGTDDRTIPYWHGKELYEAALEPKSSFWAEGATHDDVPWSPGYWQSINSFVAGMANVDQ